MQIWFSVAITVAHLQCPKHKERHYKCILFNPCKSCEFEYHEPHFIEEMEMEEGEITSPKFQSEWYVNPRVRTPRLIFNQHPCLFRHDAQLLCMLSCFSHVGLCDPTRLLCPWNFPGKNTGVGCHALLKGSSQPRDWTLISYISCIGRQVLYH